MKDQNGKEVTQFKRKKRNNNKEETEEIEKNKH